MAQLAEPLTPYEVAHVKQRMEAATRYPWMFDSERGLVSSDGKVIARMGAGFDLDAQDAANARFIAEARYDVAALLATLEALRREQAPLRAIVATVADGNPMADDWSLSRITVPYETVEKARALLRT
jgi:hypothetical protein